MGGVSPGLHICPQAQDKVADALSGRVMILVAMSAEVTGFERLREEYESCPDFREIYVTL